MEELNRDFKGVWIPKEVYLSKELSWTEKILLVEIDSLDNEDGCFSKNDYFANFLGVSETHVSRMISKLKKLGLISVESFDGRTRVLHSNLSANPALSAISESNNMQECQSSIDNDVKADYAKRSRQTMQKCQGRLCKNADHNNTTSNIYNNIYKENKKKVLDKPKQRSNKFIPPTVEEIRAYCKERKNNVDPESFYDFYESKGWMVGKTKMKDWKAAVRTWERRDGNTTKGQHKKENGYLC